MLIARLSMLAGFLTLTMVCLSAAHAVELDPVCQLLPVSVLGLWFAATSAAVLTVSAITRIATPPQNRTWRDRPRRRRKGSR